MVIGRIITMYSEKNHCTPKSKTTTGCLAVEEFLASSQLGVVRLRPQSVEVLLLTRRLAEELQLVVPANNTKLNKKF